MLKKCIRDLVSILHVEGLKVDTNLYYEEEAIEMLDWKVKKLRNKEESSVKVLWNNHLLENATLEVEADMMNRYRHLFLPFLVKV